MIALSTGYPVPALISVYYITPERERELRPSRPPLHHKPQVTCVGAEVLPQVVEHFCEK